MFIYYYINPDNSDIAFQYSSSKDSELLNEFIEEMPSCSVIEVSTEKEEYFADDAYIDLAKHLWGQLGNVPTDENGSDGSIDAPFLHFEKGTGVHTIWHWFESTFTLSVAKHLMFS